MIQLGVAVTDGAIHHLAEHMNPQDAAEVKLATGDDPLEALYAGLDLSEESWIATEDEQPIAMYGVGTYPVDPRFGVPWLLGTPRVAKHGLTLIRAGRALVARWGQRYSALFNVVSAEHVAAHRWLTRLGFEPIRLFHLHAHPFIEFTRLTPCPQPVPHS